MAPTNIRLSWGDINVRIVRDVQVIIVRNNHTANVFNTEYKTDTLRLLNISHNSTFPNQKFLLYLSKIKIVLFTCKGFCLTLHVDFFSKELCGPRHLPGSHEKGRENCNNT